AVSVTEWETMRMRRRFGRTYDAPPGIAGIAAFSGPHATGRIGGAPDPDRIVTVGCEAGPVVSVGGTIVHTSITAPARALRNGSPVEAVPCSDGPVHTAAGEQDVDVRPGGAFTVDSVTLTDTSIAP